MPADLRRAPRARPPRRNRSLVAPFVVTVLAAPGCGNGAMPPKEPPPASSAPTEVPLPTPSTPSNAAPPEGMASDAATAGNATDAAPPAPPAPPGDGAWQNEGTDESPRWAFVYAEPKQPSKPSGKKPSPTPGGHTPSRVTLAPNGSCSFLGGMDCPPGAYCNPPPPYEVQCPPGLEEARKAGK